MDTVMKPESRPWPVKALTLLLFLQVAGLLGIGSYNFYMYARLEDVVEVTPGALLSIASTVLASSGLFGALALLALLAAVGFWGGWRSGWSIAMLTQGVMLLLALGFYFQLRRIYVYPMMVYGIFMVVYLYHPDVQAAFHVKPAPDNAEAPL